jgi:hypothetical protein
MVRRVRTGESSAPRREVRAVKVKGELHYRLPRIAPFAKIQSPVRIGKGAAKAMTGVRICFDWPIQRSPAIMAFAWQPRSRELRDQIEEPKSMTAQQGFDVLFSLFVLGWS